MTAVFCVDAFGGGFIVNALVILWLVQRFEPRLASDLILLRWNFSCLSAACGRANQSAYRTGSNLRCWPCAVVEPIADRVGFAPSFGLAATCLILGFFRVQTTCQRDSSSFSVMSHPSFSAPRGIQVHPVALQSGGCCRPINVRMAPVSVDYCRLASSGCRMCSANLCASVLVEALGTLIARRGVPAGKFAHNASDSGVQAGGFPGLSPEDDQGPHRRLGGLPSGCPSWLTSAGGVHGEPEATG